LRVQLLSIVFIQFAEVAVLVSVFRMIFLVFLPITKTASHLSCSAPCAHMKGPVLPCCSHVDLSSHKSVTPAPPDPPMNPRATPNPIFSREKQYPALSTASNAHCERLLAKNDSLQIEVVVSPSISSSITFLWPWHPPHFIHFEIIEDIFTTAVSDGSPDETAISLERNQ
jgi:hypothetical protein